MKLTGKRIAILLEDGFEDLEFYVPLMRLREEGAQVTIVSTKMETFQGKHGLKAAPDTTADQVSAGDFEALVIPGGWAPDKLRRSEAVVKLTRQISEQGKIIGAICHAGSVLISAGIVEGRKVTGSPGIKDDLVYAGGEWVDTPAFREGNLVWGRVDKDIPEFCRELVQALSE